MADFSPEQSSKLTSPTTDHNIVGTFGSSLSLFIFWSFGVAGWFFPILLFFLSWLLVSRNRGIAWVRILALICAMTSATALLSMQESFTVNPNILPENPGGGLLGKAIYKDFLRDLLGPFGSFVILGLLYALSCTLLFVRNIGAEMRKAIEELRAWRERKREEQELLAEARAKEKEAAAALLNEPENPAKGKRSRLSTADTPDAVAVGQILTDPAKDKPAPRSKLPAQPAPLQPEDEPDFNEPAARKPEPAPKPATTRQPAPAEPQTSGSPLKIVVVPPTEKASGPTVPTREGSYQFPPITLLSEPVPAPATDESEHETNASLLLKTLGEFGVTVTLGEIHSGPVITRYEVYPAPGVRVEKIASLDKNLALALRAQSVRILAPVPGKGCVGIEVPNAKPTPVGIRELIESQPWAETKAEIPLALGREVDGAPVVSDLTRMPHLLIAGATGSGKSVCINAIVASLVYRFSPADLRLIMVDPKIVELSVYNDLPHMLIPVVTNPKKVPGALKWLIGEMERRYQAFAKVRVRNIVGFNNRKNKEKAKAEPVDELDIDLPLPDEEAPPDRYPYIVAIIDEIADLMMVAPAEIEQGIARLAQLARAAGIHLILATQRPSVNVITGVIKANLPCRIAFQVSSNVDSRTIIDTKGAEQLIGRGDMLFSPPGSSKLIRAQGAFLTDEEVRDIVEFLKRNGPPAYADDVQEQIERSGLEDEEGGDGDSDDGLDDDPMLPQALAVLRATRRASTSMLQRRLRIGYNRAARLMELMESKGIVGPENGAQPRDILVDLDTYEL
jgi:S-DNA-T family DNA segregation ATPase FtsK/SpoIIIE